MASTTSSLLNQAIALSSGVGAHLLFFKHGERHLWPFRYVQALILAIITVTVTQTQYADVPLAQSFRATLQYALLFLVGCYSSVITYRLFFNPLNNIPGPYFARLTQFNHVFRNAKFDQHHQLLKLHQKYGRFVRIGPNDVSCTHPDGHEVTLGVKSKCTKAQWYSNDTPMISMHTTRDKAFHDRRRRIWSPAFSDKALRGYENRMKKYNDLLLKHIDENVDQPINMSKWFNYYSFDVMGDLAWGQSYGMLESGQTHFAIKLLSEGMDPLGFAFPPWFFRVLTAIPGLSAGYFKLIAFCNKQMDDRMKTHEQRKKDGGDPDIAAVLVEHFVQTQADKDPVALKLIQGDARLIIVAGSDTTAATLVHVFYHLASQPSVLETLRNSLSPLIDSNDDVQHQKIQDCEYLNGVIYEALRLNPPVPSGVFRKTPKEGVVIGGVWIPGDTVVQMPTFVMARDSSIYPSPTTFEPLRWSTKPEMIKDANAFAPFSMGPFGCIGKNLALMEVRLLVAELVMKFDVKFAPGEDGSGLLEKSTDHFTMGLADMNLVFSRRA